MLATERLLEIEEKFSRALQRVVPTELDDDTLHVILYLNDGSNLRVTEQWDGNDLKRYSYYWLTPANKLKVGWDNAPHHKRLENFPHHKHVGQQGELLPSKETCLEEVMRNIFSSQYPAKRKSD